MNVFIIRPFKTKEGINFDEVDTKLIQPALKKLGISGGTTGTIIRAGNIRIDMFEQLLMADLVIADITIHNANVFYELGIRQSLRDKHTFLIKGEWRSTPSKKRKEVPFDLKTDRYLDYPIEDPARAVDELTKSLKDTLDESLPDSPIYFSLPTLRAQNPEDFLAVPIDFGEEEEIASAQPIFHHKVGKLTLLAFEVETYPWRRQAFRLLGESLYRKGAYEGAQHIWEKVRNGREFRNDIQANDRLATIYQRMAEQNIMGQWDELLTRSDQALERLNGQKANLNRHQRAEVYSLMARNAKTRWQKLLETVEVKDRQRKALESSLLQESFEKYQAGYYEDLNHYYSGSNALWMLTILLALIDQHPDEWQAKFSSAKKAEQMIEELKTSRPRLSACLEVSLEAAERLSELSGKDIPWHLSTRADLACLIEANPTRIAKLYINAIQKIPSFSIDSIRRQLLMAQQLGVLSANIEAVLKILPASSIPKTHFILFTGHMIDIPERAIPRFPASAESAARTVIYSTIEHLLKLNDGAKVIGIAGGASGGDILFHEVCQQLGVESELFLAAPRDLFVTDSVAPAGADWINRFDQLYEKLPRQLLGDQLDLPTWLRNKSNYSIWERNNLWMLYSALACGGQNMTLIALWDEKSGDGPGGTEHMVEQVKSKGGRIRIIDTKKLF